MPGYTHSIYRDLTFDLSLAGCYSEISRVLTWNPKRKVGILNIGRIKMINYLVHLFTMLEMSL